MRPAGIGLNDLVQLGPINVLKVRFVPVGLNRRHVAELWFSPNGSRILEISTKSLPAAAFQAAAKIAGVPVGTGRDPDGCATDQDKGRP